MKKIYCILSLAAAFCAFTPFVKAQGIVASGEEWTESNGLGYRKYISEPNTEGVYYITLESFTTGKVEITQQSIPCDITLVLDTSGSMGYKMTSNSSGNDNSSNPDDWTRRKHLKNAVLAFIDAINDNDLYYPDDGDPTTPREPRPNRLGNRIGIITFAAQGTSSVKAPLTYLEGNGLSTLKSVVNGLTAPNGQTWADEGMQKAYTQQNFDDDTRKRRTTIMFTDGVPGGGTAWGSTTTQGGVKCLTTGSYNTWYCGNRVINYANDIKNITNEAKDIVSSVYTVSVINNPDNYTKVYLGKTSSEWLGATKMADLVRYNNTYYRFPDWNSTNIWANGDGTRNDDGKTYAYATTNATELKNIFETIASSSGGAEGELSSSSIANVDVVSASFALPAGASDSSIEVYTVRYTGDNTDGSHNFKTKTVGGKVVDDAIKAKTNTDTYTRHYKDDQGEHTEEGVDVDDAITWHLTASTSGGKKDKITVEGFDYANLWCGPDPTVTSGDYQGWHQGYKLVIKIPVKMDDEAVGGPSLNTNGPGSGIYVNGVNQFPFVSPQVSLPVNIHIRKEGLEVGESAKFRIDRSADGGNTWTPVTSVFVTRTENDAKEGENAPITKIVGMPATDNSTPAKKYIYKIVEEPWTWSYVSGHSTTDRTDLLEVNPFIFTNTKKNNIDNKVKNGESKAFNEFLPGNTEGSYVDSKPRTTTTTTTP